MDAFALLDWRRRMDAVFVAARSATDPEHGHRLWREQRDELFRSHSQSPLPAEDPLRRTGLPYFPYDPQHRFTLELFPADAGERTVVVGDDGDLVMRRVGRVELPEPVGASLDVWWLAQYAGGLFVPLRDGTSGAETYGGGRYLLDTAKGAWHGGTATELVLDLNFAYHPSCRYDPAWQCPLAPPGNTVQARVVAGERLP